MRFPQQQVLLFILMVHHNHRLVTRTFNDLEWPEIDIALNQGITKSPTNQPLCICNIIIPYYIKNRAPQIVDGKTLLENNEEQEEARLYIFVSEKKSFKITKDRVGGIPGNLVLGGITDQVLHRSESNIRGCGPFALIIHYYLYSFILPHCHA